MLIYNGAISKESTMGDSDVCIIDYTFEWTESTNLWLRDHLEVKRKLMIVLSFMLDCL